MSGTKTTRIGQKEVVHIHKKVKGTIPGDKAKLEDGIAYLKSELKAKRRVVIGVHREGYTKKYPNSSKDSGNDWTTHHFVTAYGYEYKDGKHYIHFRDPGTGRINASKETLIYNPSTQTMRGKSPYSKYTYQMTTIRKNK